MNIAELQFVFRLFQADRSECVGRQNARQRVRFDKIFASLSAVRQAFHRLEKEEPVRLEDR